MVLLFDPDVLGALQVSALFQVPALTEDAPCWTSERMHWPSFSYSTQVDRELMSYCEVQSKRCIRAVLCEPPYWLHICKH